MTDRLDLLEAITELRATNPDLRASTLAAFRLAASEKLLVGARLYRLGDTGQVSEIITHGTATLEEARELTLVEGLREGKTPSPYEEKNLIAHALSRGKRLSGVMVLEGSDQSTARLLQHLLAQWLAVAEFIEREKAELVDENQTLRSEIRVQYSGRHLVGVSGAWKRVTDAALRVAGSTASVLITGETGTGKELIAGLIHENSPRANGPFVTVNCGAITETLLESELFGHIKGAFTGAIADHKGRFELADKGTIFLDEIGEISPAMQVRLLRVLQEMEVIRVGDSKVRKLDVRVLAATNRTLEDEVAAGRFRSDLYYRLNIIPIHIPPLRQRAEDVPVLCEHFLSRLGRRHCRYIESITREALEIMQGYPWPGNVRELENCVEKMVVMSNGPELGTDLLPMALLAYRPVKTAVSVGTQNVVVSQDFDEQVRAWCLGRVYEALEAKREDLYDTVRTKFERHLFEATLKVCDNNKSQAARLLGITRNTLNARLETISEVQRVWKAE